MTNISELVDRLTKATADQTAELLTEALALLPDGEPFSEELAAIATIAAFIAAGAFTDAALALCERLLPGWGISHIGEDYTAPPKSRIGWTVALEDMRGTRVLAMTPASLAIGIVIAVLEAHQLALSQQGERK